MISESRLPPAISDACTATEPRFARPPAAYPQVPTPTCPGLAGHRRHRSSPATSVDQTLLTKYLFHRIVRLHWKSIERGRLKTVDFSYPQEAEQFRGELIAWLS